MNQSKQVQTADAKPTFSFSPSYPTTEKFMMTQGFNPFESDVTGNTANIRTAQVQTARQNVNHIGHKSRASNRHLPVAKNGVPSDSFTESTASHLASTMPAIDVGPFSTRFVWTPEMKKVVSGGGPFEKSQSVSAPGSSWPPKNLSDPASSEFLGLPVHQPDSASPPESSTG